VLINFAFVTLGPALMPFVAELYERGEMRRLERMLRGTATLIGLPCAALSVLLFVGADTFASLVFGPERAGVALPLRILLVGQLFLFFAGHGSIVLVMAGRQRELMRSTVAIGAAYAVVCPLASYFWGVPGAAVAKSLATGERAAAATIIVRKALGIRTTASLSPEVIKDSVRLLVRGRRRREVVDDASAEASAE
jgi:O-antigen/teichoic acid export membrane protein